MNGKRTGILRHVAQSLSLSIFMAFADGSVQNVFCTMPTATAAPPSTAGDSAPCTPVLLLDFLSVDRSYLS